MFASIDWHQPIVLVNALVILGLLLSGLPLLFVRRHGPGERIIPVYRAPALLLLIAHCVLLVISHESTVAQSLAILCGVNGYILMSAEIRALSNPDSAWRIAWYGIATVSLVTILLVTHSLLFPEQYFGRVMIGLLIGSATSWLIFSEALNIERERFARYRVLICTFAVAIMYAFLVRVHFSLQHSIGVLVQPYHEPSVVLWARAGSMMCALLIFACLNAFYLETLIATGRRGLKETTPPSPTVPARLIEVVIAP